MSFMQTNFMIMGLAIITFSAFGGLIGGVAITNTKLYNKFLHLSKYKPIFVGLSFIVSTFMGIYLAIVTELMILSLIK